MGVAKNIQERFWKYTEIKKSNDCWVWTGARHSAGYGLLQLKGKKTRRAHRISYAIHNNLNLEDMPIFMVLHNCDNPSCVNPKHLRLGTHQDNTNDRKKRGRYKTGEKHAKVKLTLVQVKIIKDLPREKINVTRLAKKYGVTTGAIYGIWNGQSWREHV